MEKMYTVDEVAALTGLTSRTIRSYIAAGKLTGSRLGSQWRFTEKDIERLYIPGGAAEQSGSAEGSAASRTAERVAELIDSKSSGMTLCTVISCGSDIENTEVERRLKDAVSVYGGAYERIDENVHTHFVLSGSIDQTAKLIKSVRKG